MARRKASAPVAPKKKPSNIGRTLLGLVLVGVLILVVLPSEAAGEQLRDPRVRASVLVGGALLVLMLARGMGKDRFVGAMAISVVAAVAFGAFGYQPLSERFGKPVAEQAAEACPAGTRVRTNLTDEQMRAFIKGEVAAAKACAKAARR